MRGQRTHTNARTRKGPRKTVAGKKKAPAQEVERGKSKHGQGRARRRSRRTSPTGVVHIQSTFNNTIVTITDTGNAIVVVERRRAGFKGSRKWTPFAAQVAAEDGAKQGDGARHAQRVGLREGPGRRPRVGAARARRPRACEVNMIRDVTPIPHNGCRPPKRRRV